MRKTLVVFSFIVAVAGFVSSQPVDNPASVYGNISLDGGDISDSSFADATIQVRDGDEVFDSMSFNDASFGGPDAGDGKLLVPAGVNVSLYIGGIKTQNQYNFEQGIESVSVELSPGKSISARSEKESSQQKASVPENLQNENEFRSVKADLSKPVEGGFDVTLDADIPELDDYEIKSKAKINPAGFGNSDVEDGEVSFKVSNNEFGSSSQVYIFHYEGGEWNKLDTSIKSEQEDYTVFSAPVESFSPYSVATDTENPSADIAYDPSNPEPSEDIDFNASDSTDNVEITSYNWDLDDGSSASGESVTHSFEDVGSYLVELTVEDSSGNEDTDTVEIEVEESPNTTDNSTDNSASGAQQQDNIEQQSNNSTDQTGDDQQSDAQTQNQTDPEDDTTGESDTDTQQQDDSPSTNGGITGQFTGSPGALGGVLLILIVLIVAALEYTGRTDVKESVRELTQSISSNDEETENTDYSFN
ncbi:MAG: hypothetical protein BRC29_01485 [Nanohaloarchaea archaeon SW_7_43_1]|nr:MAG: hypothetical protein BRC29_01485 [Nanohaloarchaea archaeon SW_7_43_1]